MQSNSGLFHSDPRTASIPNDGVAKVLVPTTPEEWRVLRYELTNFVCDGEYRAGLERILSSFLRALGESVQPSAWVSGFYGSGKSHLARMLEILWRDLQFPDGARARGIVQLPDDITALLRELQTAGNREGGLWSVGGTLGASAHQSVRLAILEVVFRGAELPARYPQARFTLWLRSNGFYDAVRAGVEAAGRQWESELSTMLVSPCLSQALLAAYPAFAQTDAAARQLLKAQFPNVDDISDDEMLEVMDSVLRTVSGALGKPGKLPLTLIVLDELQQYLADNHERMLRVQNVQESISTKFGGRVLIVATGQSALIGSPTLSKLQGRFTVNVGLSDKDVETVVRQVVLRKKPDAAAPLADMLDRCSGEIDRHLAGTAIAPSPSDTIDLKAADYPLLPVRRRFWERVLRAVDRAGAAGQLRTQLKVVHEAVREIADRPLGVVVAADRIYSQIASSLLQSGVLLREVYETIEQQEDGTPEGALRRRLCSLIFLICQLPREVGADTGIRATAHTLADLLVEDLPAGSAALRGRVPDLLEGMVANGQMMVVENEYRLQTRESAEWQAYFKSQHAAYSGNAVRLATDRAAALKSACTTALKDLSIVCGESKTPRKLDLLFTAEAPPHDSGAIPVWIRDEWSVSEKTVLEDARAAGVEGPVIYVHLPRRSSEELASALAGREAATEALARPTAQTNEATEARQSMETRKTSFQNQIHALIAAVIKDAQVFQGGGARVESAGLRASVEEAMKASLDRLYPDFKVGDNGAWDTVKKRVREGSGDALAALGYNGEARDHPACQRVLQYIGAQSRKGLDIRKRFTGPPFGWPQDAADGAILALAMAGSLRASINGAAIAAQAIDQSRLGQTDFRSETAEVTASQRIAVRALISRAGVPCKAGEEAHALTPYVHALKGLAGEAGGDPPLPCRPSTKLLDDLDALSGNDAILEAHKQIAALDHLRTAWTAAAGLAAKRRPRWQALQRLLKHAAGLPAHADAALQAEAIAANRSLLIDPDPVHPLCAILGDALRAAAKAAGDRHREAYDQQMAGLDANATWQQLEADGRRQILAQAELAPLSAPDVGTEDKLLDALDAAPLAQWSSRTAALPAQAAKALLQAERRLEPKAVQVKTPPASLKTEAEVDAYLQTLRAEIMAQIHAGHPVVI